MSRLVTYKVAAGVLGSVILTLFAVRPAVAADDQDNQDVRQAEDSLLKALETKDAAAVGTFLNADFQWANADGKVRTKCRPWLS